MKVEIIGWNDLKDQFGLYSTDTHKGAKEMSTELTNKATKDPNYLVKNICIDYEKDNFDSGFCQFTLKNVTHDSLSYEYIGTAK